MKPTKKAGEKVKCRLCGSSFALEKYKPNQKYCPKCKYGLARRGSAKKTILKNY